jgi:hypothetical protein
VLHEACRHTNALPVQTYCPDTTNQTTAALVDPTGAPTDPRHAFTCSHEVVLRYRWQRARDLKERGTV